MAVTYNYDKRGVLIPVGQARGSLQHQIINFVHGAYIVDLQHALREKPELEDAVSLDVLDNLDVGFATFTVDKGDTHLTIFKVRDAYLLEALFTGLPPIEPDEDCRIVEREVVTDGDPIRDIKWEQLKNMMTAHDAWFAVFDRIFNLK